MRIGIDFDNTIVCYDDAFRAAALERGLIAAGLEADKSTLRDHLNGSGRSEAFTALQGEVYGARMGLAAPYPGVERFLTEARRRGHEAFVVSHRTRAPIRGPACDLHEAARAFLRRRKLIGEGLVPEACVFFEPTREDKLGRAVALGVDVFIDDLPEVLTHPGLPSGIRRILFDPADRLAARAAEAGLERYCDWPSIRRAVLA